MNSKHSTSPKRLLLLSSILLAFAGSAHAAQFTVPAAIATNQLDFTVYLPLQHQADLDALLVQQQTAGSANYHKWLTPSQFKSQFGADPASVARVKQHLANNGLSVVSEGATSLRVRGNATAVATALGMSLGIKQISGAQRVVSAARQQLRAELSNEGAVVPTFSTVAEHHTHSVKFVTLPSTLPNNRSSSFGGYWYDDLKQAYDFPAYSTTPGQGLSGKGATVAILMSSDFLDSDLKAQFTHEGWTGPYPTTVHVPINGAKLNRKADAFGEAALDTQQVGGMAPGATIMEYNIPDLSDESILSGYVTIVETNAADVVSSSFGGAEEGYLPAYNGGTDYSGILTVYNDLFKQGNSQGITFVASSGDSGGLGAPSVSYITGSGPATFVPAVENPASSPNVTAVGGTNLQTSFTSGSLNSAYVGENAYGDPETPYDPWGFGTNVSGGYWGSGGGVSKVFAQPSYQKLVATGSTTMRTVPDISLMEGGCPGGLSAVSSACPASGPTVGRSYVLTYINGTLSGLIGTSVSAPGIAGVIALGVEQTGGRFGNINTLLYTKAAAQARHLGPAVFHNAAINGFNGYENTGPIYNQVIGLGTPDVRLLIGAQALPAAGIPQSATNP